MWGMLVGLLFMNPLAGMALGAIAGAGAGALSGSLADYGIRDDFIKKLAGTIPEGSSALFVLFRNVTEDKVLPEIEPYKPRVLKTSLSNEAEAKLRAALSKAASAQPREVWEQTDSVIQTPKAQPIARRERWGGGLRSCCEGAHCRTHTGRGDASLALCRRWRSPRRCTTPSFGSEFSHALLHVVTGRDKASLDSALSQPEEAEPLFRTRAPPDVRYSFRPSV
jgi:hypothetical protein